ncbi:MAG: NAD(P)H-binding protein [Acidimicrobiia bacterium]|nr:NAD(P)H-binding protein [Acidimicrobiia bacterium]
MRVLVTGGRGTLGKLVVAALTGAGHDVGVGTRKPRDECDVRYDLDEPIDLDGFDVVVHLASDPMRPERDVTGARHLVEAALAAGVGHLAYVSIVGVDHHPYPYYRAKYAAEKVIEESGVPHTILRATQFHSLIPRFADAMGSFGFVAFPTGIEIQSIDERLVASRVVDLATRPPAGRVDDMGGPETLDLLEMARNHVHANGRRTPVIGVPIGGRVVRAFRDGIHHTSNRQGGTYREYLDDRPPTLPRIARGFRWAGMVLGLTVLVMLAAPAVFHSDFAAYGAFNRHFIRDTATFAAPMAAALWMAAARPRWRLPVAGLAVFQNGLHVINHLIDVGGTEPGWHGPVNLALLVAYEAWFVFLLRTTVRPETHPRVPAVTV